MKKIKKQKTKKKVIAEKQTSKNNLAKKAEIDKIFDDFALKISKLKQERDAVVLNFLDTLKEKRIEELKKSLNY